MKPILPLAIIVVVAILLIYSFIYPSPDEIDNESIPIENLFPEYPEPLESQNIRQPMALKRVIEMKNASSMSFDPVQREVYVSSMDGIIFRIAGGIANPFLDIKFCKNLYQIVFYQNLIYCYYSASGEHRLSRFHADGTEEIILRIADSNGMKKMSGCFYVKNDLLYLATGSIDRSMGLNLNDWKGKLLCLDITVKRGYKVPPENPYMNNPAAKSEILMEDFRCPSCITTFMDNKVFLTDSDISEKIYTLDLYSRDREIIFKYKEPQSQIVGCIYIDGIGLFIADKIGKIMRLEYNPNPLESDRWTLMETLDVPLNILGIQTLPESRIPTIFILTSIAIFQLVF
jgi:hypothetical protein